MTFALPSQQLGPAYLQRFVAVNFPQTCNEVRPTFWHRRLDRRQPCNDALALGDLDDLPFFQEPLDFGKVIAEISNARPLHDVIHFSIT
jgi:hypothetical protein